MLPMRWLRTQKTVDPIGNDLAWHNPAPDEYDLYAQQAKMREAIEFSAPVSPAGPVFHRIIPVSCPTTPTLLVTRWEQGEEIEDVQYGVVLHAWHKNDEWETHQEQFEFISMDVDHIAAFIRDYSQASANEFVNRFNS